MNSRTVNNILSISISLLFGIVLIAAFAILDISREFESKSNAINQKARIALGLFVNGEISNDRAKIVWREIDAKFADHEASRPEMLKLISTLFYIGKCLVAGIFSLSLLLIWRTRREIRKEWLELLAYFKLQSKPTA